MIPENNNNLLDDNFENNFIYHYIEEIVSSYGNYIKHKINEEEITMKELPFLLRIHFMKDTTQKQLVELFNVSEGQTAKILRKFEEKQYIVRYENPENHRIKIVKLTDSGIKVVRKYVKFIDEWEADITQNMTKDEKTQLKKLLYKMLR
jgi:DNA-binding MarR family transcriptional regulator